MQRGFFIHRGDAHQAPHRQIEIPAFPDKGIGITGQDPCLLHLFAGVHLDEQFGAFPLFLGQPGQGMGQLGPVDRMDRVKQGDRLPRFVGLQWPDQVQVDAGKISAETGPFARGLLHLVFTIAAVALLQHMPHPLIGLHLADGNQGDGPGRATRIGFGLGQSGGDVCQTHDVPLAALRRTEQHGGRNEKGQAQGPPQIDQVLFNLEVEANTQVSNGMTSEQLCNTTADGRTATQIVVEVDTVTGVLSWCTKNGVRVRDIGFDIRCRANVKTGRKSYLITIDAVVSIGQ